MDLTKPDPNSPAARRARNAAASHVSGVAAQQQAAMAAETTPQTAAAGKSVLSVSQLNREARLILEHGLANVIVEGEISNLARPNSGHWYFTLKDSQAQIRCAMFRQRNRLVRPAPNEGDKVQLKGKLTLYEARGDYQLVVDHMEPAGEGALRQAYERLKAQLEQEGLFAEARKRALPAWPQTIGVITSASGAAVRDIIDVIGRRYPSGRVVLYPTSVQGESAPTEIRQALNSAVSRQEAEVLIIGRGGGSLEDLWAFNDEALVRDVVACPIPIVSAVGHETDFSLCDFVADLRAPTPSAAAELTTPLADDWLAWLDTIGSQLKKSLQRRLQQQQQQLDHYQHRLEQQHPLRRLDPYRQRLAAQHSRLQAVMGKQLTPHQQRLSGLQLRLSRQTPQNTLAKLQQRQALLTQQLTQSGKQLTRNATQRLSQLSGKLDIVSPLATLQRGYAIATDGNNTAITTTKQVKDGDAISVKLADGELGCRVETTK